MLILLVNMIYALALLIKTIVAVIRWTRAATVVKLVLLSSQLNEQNYFTKRVGCKIANRTRAISL